MAKEVFVYEVDADDVIVRVSENWQGFAAANSEAFDCRPEKVVGRSLWDYIVGREVRMVYVEVFKRVRRGHDVGPIPFRCDSPRERRYLDLTLEGLMDGHIALKSRILRTEDRPYVALLDRDSPRSTQLVKICSICKKVALALDQWVEIEEGLARLRIFEEDLQPDLTHSLCPRCYQVSMDRLERYKESLSNG